tara:strand:- start:53920 stop:54579 length:660 start_codon:yes stop_codon:yes gene_type:complete
MICLIPARGGSKSIPLKNITLVNGKPLIWWVLNSAMDSTIDEIYVSTDSDKIKEVVESYNFDRVQVIDRSPEVSTDEATTESVIKEFSDNHDFDDLMIIQPTSPLLKWQHIDEAIDSYKHYPHDSLVSLIRQHNFRWEIDDNFHLNPRYDLNNRPRRQDHDGYLVENGALYITSKEAFLNSGCRVSGGIGYYIMPPYTAYEIDDPEDIIIVEELLRKYG